MWEPMGLFCTAYSLSVSEGGMHYKPNPGDHRAVQGQLHAHSHIKPFGHAAKRAASFNSQQAKLKR